MSWKPDDVFAAQPIDPRQLPYFEATGAIAVIPFMEWMAEYHATLDSGDIVALEQYYTEHYSSHIGDLASFTPERRGAAIDFAFKQLILNAVIMPLAAQARLLYDNVYLVRTWDDGEAFTGRLIAPRDKTLRPRIATETGTLDGLFIPYRLLLDFADHITAKGDNRDRRLRRPGWTRERNLDHLRSFHRAQSQRYFLERMYQGRATFSIIIPEIFKRVALRSTRTAVGNFQGSPAISVLCPSLAQIPWDELSDIASSETCNYLRGLIKQWDAQLGNDPRIDWRILGKRLQPILDQLFAEFEGAKITKGKAWIALGLSALPFPLGLVTNVADVVNAHTDISVSTALCQLRKQAGDSSA